MWLTTLAISCPEGGTVGLSLWRLAPVHNRYFPSSERSRCARSKGHATEDMVARGRVRQADLEGNNRTVETADFGRRRQGDGIATARRVCLQACHDWYPLVMHLHLFFVAVARIAVNHDPGCGTAPDPVCSVWAPAKKAPLQEAVCEFAAAPGPSSLMDSLFWSSPHHI